MARPSRSERRARREARDRSMSGSPVPAPAGAGGDAPRPESGPRPATVRNWGWGGNFIRESIAELRKVEWPKQNQVIQGTVVVIIACVIIGAYLYACDQIFSKVIEKILGQ